MRTRSDEVGLVDALEAEPPDLLMLADPDPRVRAEAAAWAADHPEPSTLGALLDLIGRDRASRFAV